MRVGSAQKQDKAILGVLAVGAIALIGGAAFGMQGLAGLLILGAVFFFVLRS